MQPQTLQNVELKKLRNSIRKFKNLDKKFAGDVVGDGNGDIVGPFEASQGRFYRGQVIPLCVGATKTLIRSYVVWHVKQHQVMMV